MLVVAARGERENKNLPECRNALWEPGCLDRLIPQVLKDNLHWVVCSSTLLQSELEEVIVELFNCTIIVEALAIH